jgi:opacity protein-like surface antigen
MKKTILMTALSAVAITTSALAGTPSYAHSKEVVAPPPVYGTGWYFGLQVGANVYQDYGDSIEEEIGGFDISADFDDKLGIFAGLKLGYVFGTGKVRPAIELDAFYNGFESDISVDIENFGGFDADAEVHSGAGLVNFLVRFDFERFQPYLGGGVGFYYADIGDVDVTVGGQNFGTDGGGDSTGFAWQLVAGADYYFSEKFSAFLEYKFLNYEEAEIALSDDEAVRQHLVGVGLRWHF